MKQNLVVFLADMFNVLEIHPVKCVRYPGIDKTNRGEFRINLIISLSLCEDDVVLLS